jgi:hypothetical protein
VLTYTRLTGLCYAHRMGVHSALGDPAEPHHVNRNAKVRRASFFESGESTGGATHF